MTRIIHSTFFWFALLLAACELLSWRISPYRLVSRADATIRNPLGHRAWPEYLSAKDDARPLVVLISNSQGVGAEMRDKNKIYAAALRAHLSRSGYRLENWSSRGLRTTELELLVHRAIDRHARHVLLILTADNIDPARLVNLRYPFSDILLLAGDPSLWPRFRGALFMRATLSDEILSASVSLYSNLSRSHFAVTDLVASKLPLAVHPFVFGREIRAGERLDAMADPGLSVFFPAVDLVDEELTKRREALNARPVERKVDLLPERYATFETLYPLLRKELGEQGVGMTWIWQPVLPGAGSAEGRASVARFIEGATLIIEKSGVHCYDMMEALAPQSFATPGHFNEGGHRRFAELLVPIIDDEVLGRERTP